MSVTIVTWNMGRIRAKQAQAWANLEKTSHTMLALLQEGLNPPRDKSVWRDWVHYNGHKMGWGCGVVAYGCQVREFEWENFSINSNTLVVAEAVLPNQEQILISIDGPGRRANKILFERIKALGLVDCLARFHTPPISTHRNSYGQPSWQLDYLFASAALAQHLTKCDVINTPEVHGLSDHNPIVA